MDHGDHCVIHQNHGTQELILDEIVIGPCATIVPQIQHDGPESTKNLIRRLTILPHEHVNLRLENGQTRSLHTDISFKDFTECPKFLWPSSIEQWSLDSL